jgi:POT family proton-dependent oligopeptide transporter
VETKEQALDRIQNFEGKYPKQLWYLFFSEMWERFSFYGMRGMLTFFMVHQLMMKEDVANLQYGATQAFVYAFTFIGGFFADKILGFRKSLFWGGILMIVGSIILAIDPHQYFFLGISFTVIGTGFFKPNISTMVGQLYKDGDARTDAGFSLFYSGINIGALLGGYACVAIGKGYSWNLAFGLAAIVMTISLVTFLVTKKHMGPIGLQPETITADKKWYEYITYLGSLVAIPLIMTMVSKPAYTDWFMYIIGPVALVYIIIEIFKLKQKTEREKMYAALIFIVFSVFFWAFFEQSGGSLSLFAADHLNNTLLGFLKLDPNGVNNSSNSFFVILFSPIIGLIWIWLNQRKLEPNTVNKFGLGFLFLGASFVILYLCRFTANVNAIASLDVFTLAYFVMTLGELCLSPIGLSIMTKLSPKHLQGVMMGMWFLASAYGQYVAGILGAGIAQASDNASPIQKLNTYTEGYLQLGYYALAAGLILIAISFTVKKLMHEVR